MTPRRKLEELDADAQARVAAAPEWLRDYVLATCPTADEDAEASAADAQRAREKALEEREALLDLADETEAGSYGPAGIQLAQRIFAVGGRCPNNLRALRDALRELSPRTRRRRATTSEPTPFAHVAVGGKRR